jgi:hypothetical protein
MVAPEMGTLIKVYNKTKIHLNIVSNLDMLLQLSIFKLACNNRNCLLLYDYCIIFQVPMTKT